MAKTKKGANVKKEILEQAIQLFSKNGYDNTSFRNIATGLKINHAIISYHFGSKVKLFYEAIKELCTEVEVLQKSLIFSKLKTDLQNFEDHIHAVVKYFSEYPHLMRIIYLESLCDSPRKEKVLELIGHRRLFSLKYLEEAKRRGVIADVPIEEFSFILHGMVLTRFIHPVMSEQITGRSNLDASVVKDYADTIIKILRFKN